MRSAPWLVAFVVAAAGHPGGLERLAFAQVEFRVTTEQLPAEWKPLGRQFEAHIVAAAQAWVKRIDAKPCTIEIVFRVDPAANRGSGRSLTTARFADEKHDGKLISEQGWASEMRTGEDPNGDTPDVEVVLEPTYMRRLWWDPNPAQRRAPVPGNKLDAMTVILHELGHALAFNGWIDPKTGELPGDFASTYDRWVSHDGTDFFFNGPSAIKLWRGPVPLSKTNNNYHHVCDKPQGPQAKLKEDLMNGVTFEDGKRYWIGLLDLAILSDCGIPTKAQKAR